MNKRIIFLLVFSIFVAFSSNLQAVELYETGNVAIHGFISQGYLQSGGNNFFADTKDDGTFQYSEAGINFTTDVSDRLSLGIQLFSRDLGKMGNHEVTVDWAFADYSFTDWLNFKAGKVKLPYGLYNTERDVDMLRTFVFLPQSIYYEGWRDSANALNGAGFYGYVEAGFFGSFSYEAYLGNSIVPEDAGVARMLSDQTPAYMELELEEVDVEYTNAATLTWETIFGLEGLRIVGSLWAIEFDAESKFWLGDVDMGIYAGGIPLFGSGGVEGTHYQFDITDPTATSRASAAGFDSFKAFRKSTFEVKNITTAISLEYVYDNLVFATEVMQNDYDLNLVGTPVASKFKTLGWYSSLTYRFTDWLELGTYYSEYYSDKDDKDGKDHEEAGTGPAHEQYLKDLCLTARFDISSSWILKVEGHEMKGASLLYRTDDNADEYGNADYKKDWHMGAVKLTYSF